MLRTLSASWLLLVLLCHIATAKSPPAPQATLDIGTIFKGIADTKHGVANWRGIRYAQPPLGKLRFAPPQPIDDKTQSSRPAAVGSTPKPSSGPAGANAALSLRPMPFLSDAWSISRNVLNSTYQAARDTLRNQTLIRRAPPVVDAAQFGPKCSQVGKSSEQSDDCLYINIWRPLTPPLEPLPVLLFIHGGGWQTGAGSDYDPTFIMKTAEANGQPLVVATINYRLNIFGFLASSDLANLAGLDPNGCSGTTDRCTTQDVGSEPVGLNLGYQDMKMAINWTYNNIDAFGGDPNKITIWGQSAGAFGVGAQLVGHPGVPLANGQSPPSSNPPRPLFRGAIMHSGAPSGAALALPVDRDPSWLEVLNVTGCNLQGAQRRVDCLRDVDWQVLRNESFRMSNEVSFGTPGPYLLGSYPWAPVIDGGSSRGAFFDRGASDILAKGNFAQVPLIAGNCADEGTIFAPKQFDSQELFESWFRQVHFATGNLTVDDAVYERIAAAYPDDPPLGSPFHPVRGPDTDRYFPGLDNQFKRAAAVYGDIRFQSNRRFLLDSGISTKTTPASWSFAWNEVRPSAPVFLGVAHGDDLDALFGNAVSPLDAVMARQWAAFAHNLDPTKAGGNMPAWPKYDLADRPTLIYANGKATVGKDDYRQEAMRVLNSDDVLEVTRR
ncbi:unnamed protein product [Parajaminaea phylloscopi]